MKIKQLQLKNFQAYEDVTFDFDLGFNCIIGPTNIGKSSVARALKFLLFNEWDESFLRKDSSFVYIKCTLENGVVVERWKGTLNKVTLTQNGKTKSFENFGFDLPEEVTQIFETIPIEIDGRKFALSIAEQDENYFLLKESGPIKAKMLGRLANLQKVDSSLSEASRLKKIAQAQKSYVEIDISDLSLRIQDLGNIDEEAVQLVQVEKLLDTVTHDYEEYQTLTLYRDKLNNIEVKGRLLGNQVTELSKLDYDQLLLDTQELNFLKQCYNKLQDLEENEKYLKSRVGDITQELLAAKNELLALKKCPLCLSDLTPEKIEEIVRI